MELYLGVKKKKRQQSTYPKYDVKNQTASHSRDFQVALCFRFLELRGFQGFMCKKV